MIVKTLLLSFITFTALIAHRDVTLKINLLNTSLSSTLQVHNNDWRFFKNIKFIEC